MLKLIKSITLIAVLSMATSNVTFAGGPEPATVDGRGGSSSPINGGQGKKIAYTISYESNN